jgi:hypothetical protein
VTDTYIIDIADLRKNYDGVEAVRGLNLQVPCGLHLRFPRTQRRRQNHRRSRSFWAWREPPAERLVFSDCVPTLQESSVDIRRRTGFVSDDKDLYGYFTVDEMIRFHRRLLPALAYRPRAALSPDIRIALQIAGSKLSPAVRALSSRCCSPSAAAPNF